MAENIGYTKIDRKDPSILQSLTSAPIYKKHAFVNARPTIIGEKITTLLEGGVFETEKIAVEGEYVVTNPSGEQYIISDKRFFARYEPTSEPGLFTAKGYCRAILNPFGYPIEIQASWGTPQVGDEKCMIADTCDVKGNLEGEPYLIEEKAFKDTYHLVSSKCPNCGGTGYIVPE